jgi:bifunctional UDP-N-acetylglucosamine pyrophosphorylase/glucosamine-1-phosphate N-acetyltransferase
MIHWTVSACERAIDRPPYIVIGPDNREIQDEISVEATFIEQVERLGTGHAVLQVADQLQGLADLILVVHADLPLLRSSSLQRLVEIQSTNTGPITLLVAHSDQSRAFGRVVRNQEGQVVEIVEEAHATPDQLALTELNVGAYCYRADWLWEKLPILPLSPKGEYYLTDLIAMAVEAGEEVAVSHVEVVDEMIGINTREHLAEAEAALRREINRNWMRAGVSMIDPDSTYIGPDVQIGQDTILYPNTILEGDTTVGLGCRVGPNTILRDTKLGDRCVVEVSVLEDAILENDVDVGPFAHLRRGAHLCDGVHVGNFGEIKESVLGPGVKMGHFSYVGDTTIGEGANIGAGAVTCNFDGERKHRTEIGPGAFIGSATMLVAPVQIGRDAHTGAGSVVTKNVPDGTMAVGIPARVIRKVKDRD